MTTAKHSGNIGDIVYSLPTIKHISELTGSKVTLYLVVGELMSQKLADTIIPLLKHQPYIESVQLYTDQLVDWDLDLFRKVSIRSGHANLGELHARAFCFNTNILDKQSLFVDDSLTYNTKKYDIVVNRTERYNNPDFPWTELLNESYGAYSKCFIGYEPEFIKFKYVHGIENLEFIKVADYLEAAWLIKNSQLFIGNCSSPYAIAETMKHDTIQESCVWCLSCIYKRPNAHYFIDTLTTF